MLYKIVDVNNISAIQQNLSHNIYGLNEIHYDENPVGKGGVGTVFKVINIDGRTETGLLVKIVTESDFLHKSYETISILHDKLNEYQKKSGRPALIDVPELNGLPFLAFMGKLEDSGNEIAGYLMRDLTYYEYNDFGSEEWDKQKYITTIGFEEKLYLCYQLTRGVDFLHEQKFIHSDLKDYSIFINLRNPQLSIIDYDGGYHYDKQGHALTIGAITSWASAKWRKIIGQGKSANDVSTSERLEEENWILASGLFEILFGMPPFYFLKSIDEETIDSYLNHNLWPEIREESPEINPQNIEFHKALLKIFKDLSQQGLKPLLDTFIRVFNEGHAKANRRLTSKQWKNTFFDINKDFIGAPRIQSFNSSTEVIKFKNEMVSFNWDTHFYNAVYVDNQLQDTLICANTLSVNDSKDVQLRVINDFGESTASIKITANKIEPIIQKFDSDVYKRTDLTPVRLSWSTVNCKSISIDGLTTNYEPAGFIEVNPMEKTKYKLIAIGFFDQTVESEIEIDVETPQIIDFRYEVNIEEGIDNVDLFWESKNANEAEINPFIGKVDSSGITHVRINDRKEFTLTVKGYFSEVSKIIEAQPFPIPMIKTLLIPTPQFNLSTTIPDHMLEVPEVLQKNFSVNFNNKVIFNETVIPFEKMKENVILASTNKNKHTPIRVSKLFDNLFNKVFKS